MGDRLQIFPRRGVSTRTHARTAFRDHSCRVLRLPIRSRGVAVGVIVQRAEEYFQLHPTRRRRGTMFPRKDYTFARLFAPAPGGSRCSGARRLARITGAALCIWFSAGACESAQDRAAAERKDSDPPLVIPWVELNTSNPSTVDTVVEGLLAWQKITDTAIVSTVPGKESLYRVLRRRVPEMRIIPGIKTTSLLSRFDSVRGWEKISRSVRDALKYASENEIVLENETAFLRVRRGEETVNLRRLRQGLKTLPAGIKVIWYPGIAGVNEAMLKRYEDVCKVVADVLDVRFVDFSFDGHKARANPWRKKAQELLNALSEHATIPILYCYGIDRWWRDEQLLDVLRSVTKDEVILYPGIKRWSQAARSISGHLSQLDSPKRKPPP